MVQAPYNPWNPSLYTTKAVIILDSEGKRIMSKYYTDDWPTAKEQFSFEKVLFEKTCKSPTGEVLLLDGNIAVYRQSVDVLIYAICSISENELMLLSALQAFYEAVCLTLKTQADKRAIMENLDLVMLTWDEVWDEG